MTFYHSIIVVYFLFSPSLGQEVSLDLPMFGYCGETITGSCTVTLSNSLTIDIDGRKSHIFTSASATDSPIELEGVTLSLTSLVQSKEKFDITISMTFTLSKSFQISCYTDNFLVKKHQVKIQSGNCSSPLIYSPDSAKIQWEAPKCPGWESYPVYTISIDSKDSIQVTTVDNSYVFPQSVEGVVNVMLFVGNSCGETTLLDSQEVNRDAIGTGGLAGDDSSDSGNQSELEKSLLVFFFIGLALPIIILVTLFTIKIAKKVWIDEK